MGAQPRCPLSMHGMLGDRANEALSFIGGLGWQKNSDSSPMTLRGLAAFDRDRSSMSLNELLRDK